MSKRDSDRIFDSSNNKFSGSVDTPISGGAKVTKKNYLKKSPSTDDNTKLKSKQRQNNISEEITANVIIFQSLSSLDQDDMYNDTSDDGRTTLKCGGDSKKGFFKSKFKTLRKGLNEGKSKIPVLPSVSVDGGSSVTNVSGSTSSGSVMSVSSGSGTGAKPKTNKKSSNFVKKLTNLNKKNKIKDTIDLKVSTPVRSSVLSLTPSPVRHFHGKTRYGTLQHDSDDGGGRTETNGTKLEKQIQTSKSLSEISLLEIDDATTITSSDNNNNNNNASKKITFMVSSTDNENNNIRLPVEPQHNNDHITTIGGHITSNNSMNTNDNSCNMMSRALSTNVINQVDITPATSQNSIDSNNSTSDRPQRSIKTLRDEFFETFKLNKSSGIGGIGSSDFSYSDINTENTSLDRDLLKIIETSNFKDDTHLQLSDDFNLAQLKREPEEIIHSEDDDHQTLVNKIEFNIGKTVNRPPKLLYPIKYSDSTDTAILINNNITANLPTNSELESSSLPSLRRKISFKHEEEDEDDFNDSEQDKCQSELSSLNFGSDGEFFSTGEFHEGSLNYLKFLSDYTLDYTEYYKPGCCDIVVSNIMTPLPMPHGDLITSDDMVSSNIMTSQPTASTSSNLNTSGQVIGGSSTSSNTIMTQQGNGGGNIMSPEKREYLYKILVIGELGTGKTSFIRRYVHNFFSQNYRATIGVDFALKVLNWDQKSIIRLQLWDIAGQERFGNMTRVYYKEAAGAFIVFDVTRSATFDAVVKWKQDLDSKVQLPDGSSIPCILLANKCDQPKQGVANNSSKLDEYVKENGFAGWYETSAKDNINIEDAAKALVNKILQNDKLINSGVLIDNDKIALSGANDGSSNRDGDSQTKKNCLQC